MINAERDMFDYVSHEKRGMIMSLQVMNTHELKAGDRIHVDSAVVVLVGTPKTWVGSTGRTVHTWYEMPIVEGMIDFFPKLTTWTIQGNDLAYWAVDRPMCR